MYEDDIIVPPEMENFPWKEAGFRDAKDFLMENMAAGQHKCYEAGIEECNKVHPRITKNVFYPTPNMRMQFLHPPKHREWLQTPKVSICYYNKHTLEWSKFNVSEAFMQMSTNAKLNMIGQIYRYLLDDEEKSMFLSDILGNKAKEE